MEKNIDIIEEDIEDDEEDIEDDEPDLYDEWVDNQLEDYFRNLKEYMKLEVGMYVRTKKGIIDRIKSSISYSGLNKKVLCDGGLLNKNKISKASFNLIDLIEVGDFVNGIEVIKIYTTARDNKRHQGIMKKDIDFGIKEILTHEQYEANCYKVGE